MQFWTDREPREKALIAIAVGLAFLLLVFQFLLKPLAAYPDEQKALYEQAELDLQRMRAGKIVLAGANPQIKDMLSVDQAQSMITSSAGAGGLTISRRQPNGEKGLTVWLERAESKLLYVWLDELTGKYNVGLVGANLNRNDDGTVRAQLTFEMGQ